MKKVLILFMLLFSTVFIYSQSAKVETYGVDPRQAEEDTTDIFPFAYNGLTNVGQQTLMYLKVQLDGQMITSPTWNVIEQPSGANAVFGDSENLNDSTQVIQFTPDIVGTYKVNYTDGAVTSDTLTIIAGLYLGYESSPVGCNTCHSDKVAEWEQTGHYMIFEEGLNGTLSSHYGPSCIKCHTTGYDENADNQGFDDWGFVFPDTLYPGQFDNMVTQYPDAMARGRIQCESCHGPGSQHYGKANVMSVTLDAQNCAWCHDEGTHHVFPAQWRASKHALLETGTTRSSCAQCHNGEGFVRYMEGESLDGITEVAKISCAVCHDPHSVENPHQLRTMTATLSNGQEVTGAGNGAICMNCHKARRDAVDYTNDYLNNLSSHYGPHHGPQADVLVGTNAITFGQDIPTSPHLQETGDACVTCHMYPATADANGNVILLGSHSFRMSDEEGNDNVAACSPCHGDIGTSFSDKKYYINGNADLDGDGVANGLQIEIEGLLKQLKSYLPQTDGEVSITDSSVTLTEAQAGYNYFMVEEDRSFGIHNPAFTFGLLKASIEALGGVVAVDYDRSNLPNDFELSQNYPNPFNPTTTIQYQLPEGSNVKVVVYDALGKQVAVLVNGYQNAGTYTTNFNASNLASGIYFYRMEAGSFVKVNKMLLLK